MDGLDVVQQNSKDIMKLQEIIPLMNFAKNASRVNLQNVKGLLNHSCYRRNYFRYEHRN